MAVSVFRLNLVLALLSSYAQADSRVRVLIIDTGVDRKIPQINEVLCPDPEHFDAIAGNLGVGPDSEGHGTHIAGIIRAIAGNKGYCLATCKFYSADVPGIVNVDNTIRCLRFAKQIGATYVNYSAGGGRHSLDERNAIADLQGTQVLVAAGNERSNLDDPYNAYYPASYGLPNVLVVGAVDANGNRSESSNYGSIVKIYMPGEAVYSATGYMTGTSQATAAATGAALRTFLGLPPIGQIKDYYDLLSKFWHLHRQGSK